MQNVYSFSKRVAIAAFIVFLIAAGFYLLSKVGYFFLLVFAAILMAVMLCGLTDIGVQKLKLKRWLSLLLVTILVFGSVIGSFMLIAPTVSDQVDKMRETIPQAVTQLKDWLTQYKWGEKLEEQIPDDLSTMLPEKQKITSKLTGLFKSTLSLLADFFIVIISALFLASNPSLYTKGFVKLMPVRKRTRVMEVLQKLYHTLKLWLLAMVSAMAIIGVSTTIGYTIIGLPLAFALGLISFFLAFIPNIGPWLAGVPAVLIGFTVSPNMALMVILVYGGIQLVETYLITPIIFQKTVDLPPALLLFFQVLLGILQGGLGLLLAAPLLAVIMVVVNELFVKDVLERDQLKVNHAGGNTRMAGDDSEK